MCDTGCLSKDLQARACSAAEKAQELMEFYLLDLSVRGEYPPYVKSYLKKNNMFPKTKPDDEVELKNQNRIL